MPPHLVDHWAAAVGDSSRAARAGEALIERWCEPHRRYHDVRHLAAVLDRIDELAGLDGPKCADLDAVRLAGYFHDAVYDLRGGTNEEDSAQLAIEVLSDLGQPAGRTAEVARMVRLTHDHRPEPSDHDGAVLCDADLAVLGGDPSAYAAYAADVRAEYAIYPDQVFVPGRIAVLAGLLDRPALFSTAGGRARWEAAARRNLSAELDLLRARAT